MKRLHTAHKAVNDWCEERGVPVELVCNEATTKAVYVPTKYKSKVQHLRGQLKSVMEQNNIHLSYRPIKTGIIFTLSTATLSEDKMTKIALDTEATCSEFYNRLDEALSEPAETIDQFNDAARDKADKWVPASGGTEVPFQTKGDNPHWMKYCYNPSEGRHQYVDLGTGPEPAAKGKLLDDKEAFQLLGESQYKKPGEALSRSDATEQFPSSIESNDDSDKKRKNPIDDPLEEALQGIAVPDDAVQPQDGIKRLQQAMKEPTRSGATLADALKKAGVETKIVGAGKHVVSFRRKGQEVWRVESISLADKKTLSETLSALWSIAAGKAPNARQMELDAKKDAAQRAREAESELENIASKYAPDEADMRPEAQPQQKLR